MFDLGMYALTKNPLSQRRVNILLIDDDWELTEVIKDGLNEKIRANLDVASDPYEAMNLLTENFYDFIILDWKLPVLNGGQTLREVEKSFRFEPGLSTEWDSGRVPVIVLSAGEKTNEKYFKTKHFECVGFVSKRQALKGILDSLMYFISRRDRVYSSVS